MTGALDDGAAARVERAADGPPSGFPGLELVPVRSVIEPGILIRIRLAPGDRPRVATGEEVLPGARLADRLRDPSVREAGRVARLPRGGRAGGGSGPDGDRPVGPGPGRPWPEAGAGPGRAAAGARQRDEVRQPDPARQPDGPRGEHLYEVGGRWRVVAGELWDAVEAPVAGRVVEVRPGMDLVLETGARGLRAAEVLGGPVRGRLAIAAPGAGEVRASSIDVGRAGTILVAGARIDAEALTRARAMGVRGIVVGGLPSKERRDFLASESRQRASRQSLPPFALLVLDGAMRRPIPSPVMAALEALDGCQVGIVDGPPALVLDESAGPPPLPTPDPGLVRIRAGALAGVEGRWAGLAGRRRFPGGMDAEAAMVTLETGETVTVPLWDLERFA